MDRVGEYQKRLGVKRLSLGKESHARRFCGKPRLELGCSDDDADVINV